MKVVRRFGPLLLVALVGLSLLECAEEDPTQPRDQDKTNSVETNHYLQSAKAAADASEIPMLAATELLADPWLGLLVDQLTVPDDAELIRQTLEALALVVESGDTRLARDHLATATSAMASYRDSGVLVPNDDVHLDLIDLFLDAVEEVLPEVDEGPPQEKKEHKENPGGQS